MSDHKDQNENSKNGEYSEYNEYRERFEKWQREAKKKLDEIDKQLGIIQSLGESARAVVDTAQKSAGKLRSEVERSEVGRQAVKAAEEAVRSAEETAQKAWEASETIRSAAGSASEIAAEVMKKAGRAAGDVFDITGERAGEIIEEAKETIGKGTKRISRAFNLGAGWARTIDSAASTISKASSWAVENPLQAAATGASMALGAGLGVVFTGLSSHWFFNSALPAWSVKMLAERFNSYLQSQEKLIAGGQLDAAGIQRLEFERDIARSIGAPLLGAYSFASGAVLMSNVLNPGTITGAPIDWIIGGNPVLERAWFFGNGIVCFKTSYDFFMIALEGQEEVERMVREISGLLPNSPL